MSRKDSVDEIYKALRGREFDGVNHEEESSEDDILNVYESDEDIFANDWAVIDQIYDNLIEGEQFGGREARSEHDQLNDLYTNHGSDKGEDDYEMEGGEEEEEE